ncbi:hexapeptide repeat [Desulfoluna spongiiphila]|nr:acyltransferase [Desulfoluna spongiiphila]VVS94982.1 hexapeptide repeat [Desulfoluna spongiiphila]
MFKLKGPSVRESVFLALANHLPRSAWADRHRYVFFRLARVGVKGRCTIWGPLTIRPIGCAGNVEIGANCFINTHVRFGVPRDKVIIGDRVLIGPQVMFETASHSLRYVEGVGRGMTTRPITVESEAWIGGGAIITQGVTIGRGAVVAAGAVVTENVDPYTVVGGVPAIYIRSVGLPAQKMAQ